MPNSTFPPPTELALPIRRIETAAICEGERSPLFLLSPGVGGQEWAVGRWDGEGWWSHDGFPLRPLFYALLPTLTVLSSFFGAG